MMRWVPRILSIAALCLAAPVWGVEIDTLLSEGVLRVLRESEIGIPKGTVSRKIEESVLKEIDPKARLLRRDEVGTVDSEGTPAVEYTSVWPKGTLYIKCWSLKPGAYDSITNAIQSFTNSPLEGVALDLRGAGGRHAKELEMVASLFLPRRSPLCRILTDRGRHASTLRAIGAPLLLAGIPTVLIVDEETEGTSEMLAGTLSGRPDILVLGKETSGMACLREFIPMGGGRFLYIATGWADWGTGVRMRVSPDVPVETRIDQVVPQPSKKGRHTEALVALLSETASDEMSRRASDVLLSRIRLNQRGKDEGKNPETE